MEDMSKSTTGDPGHDYVLLLCLNVLLGGFTIAGNYPALGNPLGTVTRYPKTIPDQMSPSQCCSLRREPLSPG